MFSRKSRWNECRQRTKWWLIVISQLLFGDYSLVAFKFHWLIFDISIYVTRFGWLYLDLYICDIYMVNKYPSWFFADYTMTVRIFLNAYSVLSTYIIAISIDFISQYAVHTSNIAYAAYRVHVPLLIHLSFYLLFPSLVVRVNVQYPGRKLGQPLGVLCRILVRTT
jgi:hypothetical protein